jgi:hypothetical protein
MRVVSIMSWALYLPRKEPWYLLDRRLDLDVVTKMKLVLCWESNPDCPACSLVTKLTELYRLSVHSYSFEQVSVLPISNYFEDCCLL